MLKDLCVIEGNDPQSMVDEIKAAQWCVCNSEEGLDCAEVQGIFWALKDRQADGCQVDGCSEGAVVLASFTFGDTTHDGWEVTGYCDYHANNPEEEMEEQEDNVVVPLFAALAEDSGFAAAAAELEAACGVGAEHETCNAVDCQTASALRKLISASSFMWSDEAEESGGFTELVFRLAPDYSDAMELLAVLTQAQSYLADLCMTLGQIVSGSGDHDCGEHGDGGSHE